MNLEWLRHHLQKEPNRVNELQVKWLENEEKQRKRFYVDAEPTNTKPLSTESKVRKVVTKATEEHDREEECLPSSSARPSKKQRREEMNEFSIGGMRNPAAAVSRLHQVRQI